MIRSFLRTLVFTAAIAASGVLGLAAALSIASTAFGEIISADFIAVESPYQVNLSGSTAYALWGTGESVTSEASVYGGPETLISTALQVNGEGSLTPLGLEAFPQWNYAVGGSTVYGGLEYYGSLGESVVLHFNALEETSYTAWLGAGGGPVNLFLRDWANDTEVELGTLQAGAYGFAAFTVAAVEMSNHYTLRAEISGEVPTAVTIGGVTAQVIAVPEPSWLMPLLMLCGGVLAYVVVDGVVWLIRTIQKQVEELDDFESRRLP